MNIMIKRALITTITAILFITPIISPLTIYAKEETSQKQGTQETTHTEDAAEASSITNSDGEKDSEIQEEMNQSSTSQKDGDIVQQPSEYSIFDEIFSAFDSYVFSNDTTEKDVKDYFEEILIKNNVQYDKVYIDEFKKIDAKEYEDGEISFEFSYLVILRGVVLQEVIILHFYQAYLGMIT